MNRCDYDENSLLLQRVQCTFSYSCRFDFFMLSMLTSKQRSSHSAILQSDRLHTQNSICSCVSPWSLGRQPPGQAAHDSWCEECLCKTRIIPHATLGDHAHRYVCTSLSGALEHPSRWLSH